MPRREQEGFDWLFVFLWLMATTWGWLLGSFVIAGVAMVVTGMAIAVLQWLVIRRRIARAWRWIAASAAGWTAGFLLLALVPPDLDVLYGLVIGGATGTAQWLLLRKEVRWAGWWIPVGALAWTTGFSLLPGALMAGAMPGFLTGIVLELLFQHHKPVKEPDLA